MVARGTSICELGDMAVTGVHGLIHSLCLNNQKFWSNSSFMSDRWKQSTGDSLQLRAGGLGDLRMAPRIRSDSGRFFGDYFSFYCRKYEYSCVFYRFSKWWHRLLNSSSVKDNEWFILGIECHCCWWPGSIRSQGISSNGIKLVFPGYYFFNSWRVTEIWIHICIFISFQHYVMA